MDSIWKLLAMLIISLCQESIGIGMGCKVLEKGRKGRMLGGLSLSLVVDPDGAERYRRVLVAERGRPLCRRAACANL